MSLSPRSMIAGLTAASGLDLERAAARMLDCLDGADRSGLLAECRAVLVREDEDGRPVDGPEWRCAAQALLQADANYQMRP